MKVLARTGKDDIAVVYIAESDEGKLVEFVESVHPPNTREKKWVLMLSTLYGCPVKCRFCDAGNYYQGRLSEEEILSQIDYLVEKRFPDKKVNVEKFKIQFTRIGEPSFNSNVLKVLTKLPGLYDAPGLIISLSTIAPVGTDDFFEKLKSIKKKKYPKNFQFQYSLHSTDENMRDWLIPVKKWDFKKMSDYGDEFYEEGGKKIVLNFALAERAIVDPEVLLKYFSPDTFIIKVTPVNPTFQMKKNGIISVLPQLKGNKIISKLQSAGYEVIVSIGDLEENFIGSNCGQYLSSYKRKNTEIEGAYTYDIQKIH